MMVEHEIVVRLRGLRKNYGVVQALRGVDLDIYGNEVFGLLGPNGAGKTTLVKLLLGLIHPSAGEISVFGFSPEQDPLAIRAGTGYVMQETAVDLYLTGRENLELQAALHNVPSNDIPGRVDQALVSSGLADSGERLVQQYSGGMRRRLEVAMGTINQPNLLLLDEPTLGLDVSSRRKLWDIIRGLRDTGVSVLMTTHYLEEANELCDRVCIISSGRIVGLGSPEQLKRETVSDLHRLTVRFKERPTFAGLELPLVAELNEFDATFEGPPEQLWETIGILRKRFGDAIDEITYAQPTLDDVFMKLTQPKEGGQ